MNAPTVDPAAELLVRINTAVAAVNEAEKTAQTAKDELVSRSKAVGMLLLEAKKLHPVVKDFLAFLKRVKGLKRSRAYDMMCVADGRKTVEEIREATRKRVEKHRSSKTAPALDKPEPEPEVSVTSAPVTETDEVSAEEEAATISRALAEFTYACRTWLPQMTEADRQSARLLVLELTNDKAEAA
jgi:hypothetical protein